jgi:hypothetical protein
MGGDPYLGVSLAQPEAQSWLEEHTDRKDVVPSATQTGCLTGHGWRFPTIRHTHRSQRAGRGGPLLAKTGGGGNEETALFKSFGIALGA